MNNNYKKYLHSWRGDLLALIAGLILPFAFAPHNLIFLAVLSPAILIGLWLVSSPKRAFVRGYLYGIGYFGVGVSWVAVSMYRFGGMAMPLASFLTIGFVLIWAFIPALVSYLLVRFFKYTSLRTKLLIVVPSLWVLFEWVRNWFLSGFPWILLGYSQTDSPLAGYAPLLGVYGVSWVIMFAAGALVLLVLESGKRRYVNLMALVSVVLIGLLLKHIEWTDPYNDSIKVSLIQGAIPQGIKWKPEQRKPTVDLYTRLTRENWGSDLVVWPETALPIYYHQARSFLERFSKEAQANNTDILIGLPVLDEKDPSRYYNGMISIGQKTDFYFKRHLVPFGEYIPLRSLLGDLLAFYKIPMANFSSGDKDKSFLEVAGLKAGITICYEDVFGEEVIQALPDAQVLVNVSNDAWFGDSFAPHQHLQKARMRALETGRPMIRATNNGVSALIDHKGNVLSVSPQFELYVLTGNVQPMSGVTPFIFYGNWLVLGFSFVSLFGILIYFYRIQRH